MLDKNVIWEEIIKEAQELNVPLQDGEMTVKMFSDMTKIEYRCARETLEVLVRKGTLNKRYANLDSHRTAIYSPT
jgi:hypothetical protein